MSEAEPRKRRRTEPEVPDSLALPESSGRRKRTVVSYSEAPVANRIGNLLVNRLLDATEGLTLVELANTLQEREEAPSKGKQYHNIRSPLVKLLHSGRVRRRLVTIPPGAPARGDTDGILQLLLLATLQIESEADAPWSLPPIEFLPLSSTTSADNVFLDPGSSSLHTHDVHAEALVGRRIEIWWGGDAQFHTALVVSYHTADERSWGGIFDGLEGFANSGPLALRHTVEYEADGLRTMEDLDGKGEPSLWRICDDVVQGSLTDGHAVRDVASVERTESAEGGQSTTRDEGTAEAAMIADGDAADEAAEAEAAAAAAEAEAAAAEAAAAAAEAAAAAAEEAAAAAAMMAGGSTGQEGGLDAAESTHTSIHTSATCSAISAVGSMDADGNRAAVASDGVSADDAYVHADGLGDSTPLNEVSVEVEASAEMGAPGEAGAPAEASFVGTASIEQLFSVNMLRNLLPACQHDVAHFHTPPGWSEEPVVLHSRRPRLQWVQRDAAGGLIRAFDRRVDVEETLEEEHTARGSAWLGQLVGGVWEIRQRAMAQALQYATLQSTDSPAPLPR